MIQSLLYVHKVLRARTGIRTGGVERHTSAFGFDSGIFNLISFTSAVFESNRLSAASLKGGIVLIYRSLLVQELLVSSVKFLLHLLTLV